jgi:gliding motility-associated-like protein
MKTNCVLFLFLLFCLCAFITEAQNCNNWLKLPSQPSYFKVGDLDIPGNKVTIEASYIRTLPWTGVDLYQGDLVSKHKGPEDCNYLLRPSSAEITTSNGYFKTPAICPIELNKTYHAALVYDGTTLKFYRNGFLMSQVAATGNLFQNDWQTQIGLYSDQVLPTQFKGYVNEVRIWNVARTQAEIQTYMNQSLPSPQTTPGLLAYYKFDDLLNKQGNAAWNGSLGGSATINEANPNCNFVADSCNVLKTATPGFIAPDTVCVNSPVTITNTSAGTSSYYWNFCVADLNTPPQGVNIGNPGNLLSAPVFIDYAFYNGNYYGFLTNHDPGNLIRLDFGNSLLNNPTAINLGNFGGIIPSGVGTEGIQIVNNEGKWYAIIVGGYTPSGSTPRILKIDFGTDLTNTTPTATNWGDLGNMSQPIDLHVFKENNNWYGFTVNAENNTITRFNFTNSFNNTPTAINLGNIGNLAYPTGIYAINDNGFWRVFVVNGGDNTRSSGTYSLTRLDFGSSLLNTPTGVNLGNPGNMLQHPRDFTIMKMCGQIVGFAVNGHFSNSNLVKLDFHNNLSSVPSVTSLGNTGNFNFPHSISKLFRVNNDVYGFIPNVANNTITRIKIDGCSSSNISGSSAQTPQPIIYNAPGTYNINLTIDDGLPTQGSICKQVVVLPPPAHSPIKNLTICNGGSIKIGSSIKHAKYLWSTGETTDSIVVNSEGTYWVESNPYGCSVRDSIIVGYSHLSLDFGFQQDICSPKTIQFTSNLSGVQSYQWDFGNGQTNTNSQTPTATYVDYGTYSIKLNVYNGSCVDSITKKIVLENNYDATIISNNDSTICLGDSILIKAAGSISNYCWKASAGVAPTLLNAYVKPAIPTTYTLTSQIVGSNLVTNSDFSLGNTGFTSEYSNANPNITEGQYWIAVNPPSWNPGLSNCHDHSSASGNMMMVNGSPKSGAKVWSQSFSVKPNTSYNFSVWISSLHGNNPAKLHFAINNVELGNDINAGSSTCQWKQFFSTWNSGDSTSAIISIVNNNTIADGNDFALDDIFFGEVKTRTDSFAVNVVGLCDSVKIKGPDKVCTQSDTLTYSIFKSPNCTQQYSMQVDRAYADIVSQTATSLKLLFKKNGTTTIKGAYADNCKIVADSLKVAIKFSPTSINLGPDIVICGDTSLVLNAGDGFVSYVWQDGSHDSTFTANTSGNYRVVAQNLCGLQLKDTISFIEHFPTPFTVSPLSATICMGDSLQFKANGGISYSWSPPGNFSHPDAATTKALVNATQDFTVFISDSICQRDTVLIVPVIASPNANISVVKSNDVNCGNDSAILMANGGISYTWSPNLYVARNNGNKITVKPYQNTTYVVHGKDEAGCFGQDSVTVFFFKEGDQKLFMPTAFTPNGDGLNDIIRPTFVGPSAKYDFRIYSRWGQLVYRSRVPGTGWDGTVNGVLQKADVYVFYINAEGGCNGKFERKGTFILIR